MYLREEVIELVGSTKAFKQRLEELGIELKEVYTDDEAIAIEGSSQPRPGSNASPGGSVALGLPLAAMDNAADNAARETAIQVHARYFERLGHYLAMPPGELQDPRIDQAMTQLQQGLEKAVPRRPHLGYAKEVKALKSAQA